MKICLISFDFWNYDQYIVRELQSRGIEAFHINVGKFHHKNLGSRIVNMFSKIFLNRNLKYEKRQQYIKETLERLGFQDKILIINPETLAPQTITYAAQHCHELMAYLYDSLDRCPAGNVLHSFSKIFSFDHGDVERHGFEKITNYNYLGPVAKSEQPILWDLYYITSFDKSRNRTLKPLCEKLSALGIRSHITVVGKKSWKRRFLAPFLKWTKNITVKFRTKTISNAAVLEDYKSAAVLLDLMRDGQTGLSFRIFEAMALEKKIVTDNPEIKNYDFYHPQNILVLEEDFSNLDAHFFKTPYQKLPAEIYQKYTLEKWVEQVFQLPPKNPQQS